MDSAELPLVKLPVEGALSLDAARQQFQIDPSVTYVNAASVGPLPRSTRDALTRHYDLTAHTPWRVDEDTAREQARMRVFAARLVDAPVSDVMYAYNTGHGINLAAFGLPLERGDEVIISDVDFPSNVYPWLALQERGVVVKMAPSRNKNFSLDELAALVTPRTKVIAVSFVQFHNGLKLPLAQISAVAKSVGAFFVVDGIQGCGPEPISVRDLEIDFFTAGAQKWLLGPLGIGFVTISPRARAAMRAVARGWMSVEWSDFLDLFQYHKPLFDDARRFSFGTAPSGHLMALASSLELLLAVGSANIQRHTHGLIDTLAELLRCDSQFTITSSMTASERSSIFTFTCPRYEELHQRLLDAKVICVRREGSIRISPYLYNTSADIARVVEIIDSWRGR